MSNRGFINPRLFITSQHRPVKDICGFSRETVIAITTNIESMEFRRRQNDDIGYEEHPRAGTTDDVEAIIAFLHRMLGIVFTLKQFKYGWKQVVRLVYPWTSFSPSFMTKAKVLTIVVTCKAQFRRPTSHVLYQIHFRS